MINMTELERVMMEIYERRSPELLQLSWNASGQPPPRQNSIPMWTGRGIRWLLWPEIQELRARGEALTLAAIRETNHDLVTKLLSKQREVFVEDVENFCRSAEALAIMKSRMEKLSQDILALYNGPINDSKKKDAAHG